MASARTVAGSGCKPQPVASAAWPWGSPWPSCIRLPRPLKVKQSAASTATVHLDQDGNATTFHVHGGGLVISRMVNEFGIAKKVAATIEEAFATRPAS